MQTATQRVAEFTSSLEHDTIPPEVREKAKVNLLHNLGIGVAGEPLVDAPLRYARLSPMPAPGEAARLLVSGRSVTPDTAAFVNAALIHARAQDDVYFPGLTHVGAMVTPALLAVGEQLGSTGAELVEALVAGYEAAGALSQGFAPRTTKRGFRASGLYGGFGAAAAVCRLLRLDAAETANALGIVASMASGTNQTWVAGTDEWQYQVGQAARNGVLAARLAQVGGRGASDALEGVAGFYPAFMGDLKGVAAAGTDLGSTWRTLAVTYKPYPVCAILQAPVMEAISLVEEHELEGDEVVAVRLALCPAEAAYPGTDSTGPFGGIGGTLMSAQFCLAVAMSQRGIKGSDLQRVDDPALLGLAQRVSVIPDDSLGPRSFRLEVDLKDRPDPVLRARHEAGEPFNWDRAEVLAHLTSRVDEIPLGPEGLMRLARVVLAAENHTVPDVVSACVVAP